MTEKNESRVITVPVDAICHFCGSSRRIDHAMPPVYIGKKKIQYIPAHTCQNCNKGYHTTFYEDLTKAVRILAIKQSMKYAVLTSIALSPISFILGIVFSNLFGL